MMLFLPIAAATDWRPLQTDQVFVACRPILTGEECEARARLNTTPGAVLAAIEDLGAYSSRYTSVQAAQQHEDGDVTLSFDLPWPLANWTVRSKVTRSIEGETQIISLQADPGSSGTVLFDRWDYRITGQGDHTEVVLRWNSDLGWPGPIRDRIHRAQGHNFLWGLAKGTGTVPMVGTEVSSR